MRRPLPTAVVLVLSPVLGLGACARPAMRDGPEAGPPPVAVPTASASSFYAQQGRLDEMAGRVARIGASYPQVFAGVELAPDHSRIIVFRIPSAPFDAAVRSALPGAPVSIVDAAHSARELNKLLDRVSADLAYWKGRGIPLNGMSPAVDGSGLRVFTTDPARARPLFVQRYGSAPIQLVAGGAVHAD